MQLIGALVYHVYKALFMRGETSLRRADTLSKILFIIATITYFTLSRYYAPVVLLVVAIVLGIWSNGFKWFSSAGLLALIPSAWYAITSYIVVLLGLPYRLEPLDIFWIGFRTYSLSILILLYFTMISSTKLYNILVRLGINKYAIVPQLIWRLIPQGLIYVYESLSISSVKRESLRNRLAPAIASIIELGNLTKLNSYYKIYGIPNNTIPITTNRKTTLTLYTLTVLTIVLTILKL
ncbi:MAG: hypothetical protein ABWW65_04105 [Thermoprotei archaeon]